MTTILGFSVVALAAYIILSGQVDGDFALALKMYVKTESLLFVLLATFGCVVVRSRVSDLVSLPRALSKAFFIKLDEPTTVIAQLMDIAQLKRKKGLVALEDLRIRDNFFQSAVEMLLFGHNRDAIVLSLRNKIFEMRERHSKASEALRSIEDIAPAAGMVGTMIGLVGMMTSMGMGDDGLGSIGRDFAIALLTTLYGSLLAFIIAKPLAEKLENYSRVEQLNNWLVHDGMGLIHDDTDPLEIGSILIQRLDSKTSQTVSLDQYPNVASAIDIGAKQKN